MFSLLSSLLFLFYNDQDVISLSRTCKSSKLLLKNYKLKSPYLINDRKYKLTGLVLCHAIDVSDDELSLLDAQDKRSIHTIEFGFNFNRPFLLPGSLPESLTTLKMGTLFNQTLLPGVLPPSLTSLTMGRWFNQTLLRDTLPASLTSLTMGKWFNQSLLPSVLPASLTELNIRS